MKYIPAHQLLLAIAMLFLSINSNVVVAYGSHDASSYDTGSGYGIAVPAGMAAAMVISEPNTSGTVYSGSESGAHASMYDESAYESDPVSEVDKPQEAAISKEKPAHQLTCDECAAYHDCPYGKQCPQECNHRCDYY